VTVTLVAAIAAGVWAVATPGRAQVSRPPLVLEPLGVKGEAIFPAFEGWGPDKTGENLLILLGYYNRNKSQELVIPVGPDNRIEPDGPDYGQPTYFYPGRQHGIFAIKVPKDFGNKRLTWTLTANGQTSTVSFWLNPPYWIDFFHHSANGNQPPIVRVARNGTTMSGPPVGIAQTLSGTVGKPIPLSLWTSDAPTLKEGAEAELRARTANTKPNPASVAIVGDQVIGGAATGAGANSKQPPDVTVNWRKHRGPGDVTFAQSQIPLVTKGDAKVVLEAATTATFHAPGEYVLRAQINDDSGDGGGGEQCCWTTVHVRVNVK
jgi:hypothetical protein